MTDRRATLRAATRLVRRHGLAGLRTAGWTYRCRHLVRRQLVRGGIDTVRLPSPPRVAGRHLDLVHRMLVRLGASCLERSLVLQRWYAAQHSPRTVVIGVTAPSAGFHAHAWLDGDTNAEREEMVEILRRPAPSNWTGRPDRAG